MIQLDHLAARTNHLISSYVDSVDDSFSSHRVKLKMVPGRAFSVSMCTTIRWLESMRQIEAADLFH
jgi:hypothetical protein